MNMMESQRIGNEFYQNLGKLFYAVAMADQSIHAKEMDTLREEVRSYWLQVDAVEDEFGTDAAFQIETVFDWLLEYGKDSGSCFDDFTTFYQEHHEKFSPKVKRLVMDTAHAIAAAFARKNKSELIILAKLKLLLQ
ncbi:hypothetical protein WIW50_03185 [Flavobacteriaceae bacterium 3-367]